VKLLPLIGTRLCENTFFTIVYLRETINWSSIQGPADSENDFEPDARRNARLPISGHPCNSPSLTFSNAASGVECNSGTLVDRLSVRNKGTQRAQFDREASAIRLGAT
jgi:hypothetical protein